MSAPATSAFSDSPPLVRSHVPDVVYSGWLCVPIGLSCLLFSTDHQHWFLLPVTACGIAVGTDAVGWLRGRLNTFDPAAMVSLVGLHLYFGAPLLHVGTCYWMPYVEPPADWRPWLGAMACLNLVGLILYRLMKACVEEGLPTSHFTQVWRVEPRLFGPLCVIALVFSSLLQLLVYAKFGGIAGYVQAFSDASDEFSGMGIVFLFSESAPIVALMATVASTRGNARKTFWFVVGLLGVFILLKLFFGGFRGSRGHLIYGLFWAATMIHVMVRPIPKRWIVYAIALLLPFMYVYGFYKSFGIDAVKALNAADRADLFDVSPHGIEAVMLGDLGRCDVQAFILYRLSPECLTSNYECVDGKTYLGTLSLLVPRTILPNRPPSKVKAGTDLLFGPGVYENEMASTFAFGTAGEAMLNFGPLGAIGAFTFLAIVVVVSRRWYCGLPRDDARWLILPLFLSIPFLMLLWDTDVLLFYVVKEGAFPGILVALASRQTTFDGEQQVR